MSKEITWYKIADHLEQISFNQNHLAEVEILGKKVCIALKANNLKACAAKCPHAGGQMSEGYIDALGNIVCPVHHYRFNLQNGRNSSGEGYFLKTYPIEYRNDGIYVGLNENNPASLAK